MKKILLLCSAIFVFSAVSVKAEVVDPDFYNKATIVDFKAKDSKIEIAGDCSNGLIMIKKVIGEPEVGKRKTYKYGYMDKRGNIVLDCIYDIATNFHEERARVVIFGNENGYINKQGEFVMQYAGAINTGGTANLHVVDGVEYRTGWSYKYGVVGYGVDKFRGLKDINGNVAAEAKFDNIRTFFEGKAIAILNGKNVVIDTKGNVLLELPFTEFMEQGSMVSGGDGTSYIYEPGFRCGILVGFNDKGEMGAINTKGEMIVPFGRYDRIGDFTGNMGMVGKYKTGNSGSMKAGFINNLGKEIIPLKYDSVSHFKDGFAIVATGNELAVINKQGSTIFKSKGYLGIGSFSEGYATITKASNTRGRVYGYLDNTGKIVHSVEYDYAHDMHSGYAVVRYVDDDKRIQKHFKKGEEKSSWNTTFLMDKNGKNVYRGVTEYHNEKVFVSVLQGTRDMIVLNETAVPKNSKVMVGNKPFELETYMINDSNYFLLKDLAYILNNTSKNFAVEWNVDKNAVEVKTNTAYKPNGTELKKGDLKSKSVPLNNSNILIDGEDFTIELESYNIQNKSYFQLRDIAKVFDLDIGWDEKIATITIDTN